MSRKRRFTPEQEKRVTEIHAELEKMRDRHAEIRRDQENLFNRDRELYLELAFIGRGQI